MVVSGHLAASHKPAIDRPFRRSQRDSFAISDQLERQPKSPTIAKDQLGVRLSGESGGPVVRCVKAIPTPSVEALR